MLSCPRLVPSSSSQIPNCSLPSLYYPHLVAPLRESFRRILLGWLASSSMFVMMFAVPFGSLHAMFRILWVWKFCMLLWPLPAKLCAFSSINTTHVVPNEPCDIAVLSLVCSVHSAAIALTKGGNVLLATTLERVLQNKQVCQSSGRLTLAMLACSLCPHVLISYLGLQGVVSLVVRAQLLGCALCYLVSKMPK